MLEFRIAFALIVAVCVITYAYGHTWVRDHWYDLTIGAGWALVLVYLFAGQLKAITLGNGIPVDWISWLGFVAVTVLAVGKVGRTVDSWRTRHERRRDVR